MSPEGKSIWKDIVPRLVKEKMVCYFDSHVIAQYCESAATEIKLQLFLRSNKQVTEYNEERAEVDILRKTQKETRALAKEIGLSPAGRKTLNIKVKTEQDVQTTSKLQNLQKR